MRLQLLALNLATAFRNFSSSSSVQPPDLGVPGGMVPMRSRDLRHTNPSCWVVIMIGRRRLPPEVPDDEGPDERESVECASGAVRRRFGSRSGELEDP